MTMKTKMQILVLGALMLAGCEGKEEKEEIIRPVFYQEAGKSITQNTRSFSGVTQSSTEAKLSFKVNGLIENVAVGMGDTVKNGTVIARLDDSDYRINYNKAEASLKNAEAQLAAAKSAFLRVENLYVNNNVSLSEYEKAKTQFESAETMMKTARSQLNAAQNQLNYTILRAPFDGVISSVIAQENEMTGAGHPVLVFAGINKLEVKTAVPENIISQINPGQDATVRFSAFPEKIFTGIIIEMSPGLPNASAYPVIVQLAESSSRLFPGMTGTVELPLKGDSLFLNRIVIATDAVGHDQSGDYVFVAVKSNESDLYVAEKRNIMLGELQADGYEIVSGLDKNELVITAGLSFLYDGRKVKLLGK
ncbi:MAG: efflux RND transporter periplasmic adaptor subunit [Sphingobacteriia bacterium]|nr:efflux RND transporter periplasmic adaptor subunit [Sphingobacteriia bacterium]